MKKYFSLLLLLVFISCKTSKQSHSMPLPFFDKQGHRGCRGLMPENTIPAMLKALDLGVTTLEMDISFSKDKKAFLSHEPFFNHEITTKPDGSFIEEREEKNYNMYKINYDSIIKYDVGIKPHPRFTDQQKMAVHKPRLADVFDAVKNYMMMAKRPYPYFNIETKTMPATDNIYHPAPAEFVELLMAVIKESQMEDYVIIQSFDFRTLQYLHKKYPTIKTALLIEDYDKQTLEEQLNTLGFTPTIYSPAYILATAVVVSKCHQKNIKIIPWTVNDKKEIERLKALGVDGIISDYPNLFNE
jgi:glycerophosphoryl diester phosphodiesterase